jgi:hypothetical protein
MDGDQVTGRLFQGMIVLDFVLFMVFTGPLRILMAVVEVLTVLGAVVWARS